ncbi:uncharacterized protein A1O9_09761 [Exophiala aquamarina CBS 119918]|uniref:Uncharacterized protein n=1 Tax=Exophiala aquamarina CBS 119918 TaxID=1182545 RepID=A0A072P283_9EURO|nr:uncharacterized protein A1O9_09761 [Exophiala aquamarina CBS 119918]KEF53966.1 hypothetical protein A1O9_09761 [Exophiala aquamarina CBS 119918]
MLLGLSPVDFVTNTSALSTGDEVLLDTLIHHSRENSSESGHLFTRIVWKRPIGTSNRLTQMKAPDRVTIDPPGLAAILYHIYLKMFESEDVTFVVFVSILKASVNVD